MNDVKYMIRSAQIVAGLPKAALASKEMYDKIGGDVGACGFGWVEVLVTRTNSPDAKVLKAAGFEKSHKRRVLTFWNPGGSPVQNVDIKYAGAQAFATHLQELGLKAYPCMRLD